MNDQEVSEHVMLVDLARNDLAETVVMLVNKFKEIQFFRMLFIW